MSSRFPAIMLKSLPPSSDPHGLFLVSIRQNGNLKVLGIIKVKAESSPDHLEEVIGVTGFEK
ncbi:MAG TPA: hypothetical protein DIW81_16705 [Planctomycetaceae bacterium]|nr:hypothetical protein [Rubinisphaera sp.]HCS53206.1 hypothetical protein [Planctomycetaceae bacterium]|tara:strand:+ start:2379 stop:2564 length:186 start_codon:yes stop_codon:yes gene_type:complete